MFECFNNFNYDYSLTISNMYSFYTTHSVKNLTINQSSY